MFIKTHKANLVLNMYYVVFEPEPVCKLASYTCTCHVVEIAVHAWLLTFRLTIFFMVDLRD